MAEAVWDGGNRKIGGASQAGCRSTEMNTDRTSTASTKRPGKKQTTHPNPYVPLPVFLASEPLAGRAIRAAGCRKTSKIVEASFDCRRLLKDVEMRRKLSAEWRRAKNTQRPSNDGSPKPGSASRNGAGKNPPRKPVKFALFGPRSKLRLLMGKAWRVSGSGSKRKVESSSRCRASAPTSRAYGGRNRPNQFHQLSLLPSPH